MTDASNDAVGAVLSQKDDRDDDHPVAYASKRLNPHESSDLQLVTKSSGLWFSRYDIGDRTCIKDLFWPKQTTRI